jgi:thiamine biosynthesis lipoprotein
MGTEVSVYFWHEDDETAAMITEEVFAEVDRINALMSTYVETSRISEINRSASDEAVVAGDELFDLIRRSLDVSEMTGGAFDITYDSVGQHYDFREGRRPDVATIEAGRARIDFRLLELDESAHSVRFLADGVRINLGGIAKGYVVERGVEILRRHSVANGLVTAGGDSRLLGDRRGRPWMIGIRDPRVDGEVAISVPLEDEAISTSGDYERFFEEDGVPVFVLGVDAGLRLIACLPGYESIVIDAGGQIFYSPGLGQPQDPDTAANSPDPGVADCD